MKRLSLFLLTLFAILSNLVAIDVTIADFSHLPTTYGSISGSTITTNAASGMAGVKITASGVALGSTYVNENYGNCLSFTTSDTDVHTITLTAPTGYTIKGYSIGASANTSSNKHVLTADDGTSVTFNSLGYNNGQFQFLNVSGIETTSTSFTIQTQNGGNILYAAYVTVYLDTKKDYVSSITSGKYYRLHSYYTTLNMTQAGSGVSSVTADDNSYSQLWQITKSGNNYTFKNVVTGNYIQSNSQQSGQWTMGSAACNFTASTKVQDEDTWFSFKNSSNSYGLHTSASQSYMVVGWNYTADASYWRLEEVELTSAQQTEVAEIQSLTTTNHSSALASFFTDNACTTLKSNYASMTDAQLRSAMSSLPSVLQNMAVSVKNNTWDSSKDATWNTYAKDFRIHEYEIFSNAILWKAKTGTGPFAHLFHPTGIQAKAGDLVCLFVDSDVLDSDASLQVECVAGVDCRGDAFTINKGYNAIYVPYECELFISYLLNNTSKSCNDYPDIKVHIEGGTCNGCFDMRGHNHTNEDWAWLKSNMFTNTYLHVKGNSNMLNTYRERVVNPSGTQNVEGIMNIFDFVFDKLQSLSGCDQWKTTGQYKMMANNYDVSTGNPHWANNYGYAQPGIHYDGIFNYNNLTNVGINGGQIWVIEHELGHGHQSPINLSGQTESSNNSLAQCVNFLTTTDPVGQQLFATTRSSRGDGVKAMISRFNNGYSWIDYGGMRTQSGTYDDVWISNKLIFQLWLYFDYMGNYQPAGGNTGFSFMTALYDKLRANGIVKSTNSSNPANATQDFLLIAKYAAEITQTDLSEYFDAWGFWETAPTVSNSNDIPESHTYFFPDYTNTYVKVTEDMVNSVRSAMRLYTKKGGNIMFLEDRCAGSTLPTYNGALVSTFGETGYYGSYAKKIVDPYNFTVSGTTVKMTGGKGAVGFKVYDADGNLVAISNTATFSVSSAIAEGLRTGTYTIKAAQGDGKDYAMGESYNASTDEPLTQLSDISNYKSYTIRTSARGWLCAPEDGEHLRPTNLAGLANDESDLKQQFALVQKNDKCYLYSVSEGKFVYDNGDNTAYVTPGVHNEITLLSTNVDDFPTAIKFVESGDQINISTGGDPGVVTNWNNISDPGNQLAIMQAETFDPTEALSWLPISSTSDISNNRAYSIFCPRGALGVSGGQLVSTSINTFTASNFAIISFEDNFYLWSVEAEKFINTDGSATNVSPTPISFNDLGGGIFQLKLGNKFINTSNGYAPGLVINGWSTLDDGNQYTIAPIEEFDPARPLYILANPSTESFTYVTSLDELSNNKSYIITNLRGTWNINDNAGSMTTKSVIDPEMASEHFALIKSNDRYYIYSINAGKYLTPSNTLSDEPQHIEIVESGNEEFPWFFRFDDSHNINVNSEGTVVINYWGGTTGGVIDDGNSCAIIEVADFNPAEALDRTSAIVTYISPWFTSHVGNLFGLLRETYNAQLSTWQSLTNACNPCEYEDLRLAIEGAVVWPETGEYRIQSSGSRIGESYIGYGTTAYGTGLRTFPAEEKLTEPSTVITLTKVEGKTGVYTIATTAGNVQAFEINGNTINKAYVVSEEEGAEFIFDPFGAGRVRISIERGQTYLHEAGSNPPGVVRWYGDNNASWWRVESTSVLGDVNGDGQVSIADVTALVNIILGKDNTQPYQYDHDAADVNGDGSTSIADVTALVNIILGKN